MSRFACRDLAPILPSGGYDSIMFYPYLGLPHAFMLRRKMISRIVREYGFRHVPSYRAPTA
jgi:hypothetical protein